MPTSDAIADAARRSPLQRRDGLSELADLEELAFREEHERYDDPAADVVRFIESKELVRKLEFALDAAGVRPRGTIVELGAGTCWLAATLARDPAVDRVVGIDFSARRIEELAPIAIAHLGAPPEKVERVVGDFYDPPVGPGEADIVITDAAYHHAADPVKLARLAYDLLRPGGELVLHREPTVSLLRRSRDHGIEDEHGSFEREYSSQEYLDQLRAAGFEPRRAPAAGGFATPRARALLRPPLSWLNGVAFSEFTYVGRKP